MEPTYNYGTLEYWQQRYRDTDQRLRRVEEELRSVRPLLSFNRYALKDVWDLVDAGILVLADPSYVGMLSRARSARANADMPLGGPP
ncbi:MAG: hypothetical protein KGI98_14555 [Euryarchaeota archaeon]|nr:hypothetical protein [Euryarchaeota archaeon]MDE1881166.1 hypothetical protein [Euryarchaeota archaeon]